MKEIIDKCIFLICRFFVRCFFGRYRVSYLKDYLKAVVEPAVYVVHHQNLRGPVISIAWFDKPLRPWVLSAFCDRSGCFRQYYEYTFTARFGLPKWFAAVIAYPLSFGVTGLMRGTRAIPVFRGSRDIVETFRESTCALTQGHNILIAPDINYKDTGAKMGEMHTGFLDLEKFYWRKTGQHLAFIPLHISKRRRQITIGKPVYYEKKDSFKREKRKAYAQLKQQFIILEKQEGKWT